MGNKNGKGKNIGNTNAKGKVSGENNGMWKGDEVGYHALHTWLRREYGIPTICENCGVTHQECGTLQWANKSGEYKRERSDWMFLCVKCHRKHDNHADKIQQAWKEGKYEFRYNHSH